MIIREQFEKLFLEPLSNIADSSQMKGTLLIVVDAPDECEGEDDIKLLIKQFSRTKTRSARLKTILNSRPELPIRVGFESSKGTYQDLVLHEIPRLVIEHDISEFLKHELAQIRSTYNQSVPNHRKLLTSWPNQSDIQDLVVMAVPLFIFAA